MILQKQDRTKSGRKRHTTKREFNCQSLPVTLSHQVHNSLLFCMSDPRPSLLSQSGCTRRYFVFSQACSFIYNPTPPFNSQPTELFALLQSGDSQKLILVTQLAGPPQVIFSTLETNKNKMNIFSSSFYFAPPATFTRICSCQLCFVNSCSRGCS